VDLAHRRDGGTVPDDPAESERVPAASAASRRLKAVMTVRSRKLVREGFVGAGAGRMTGARRLAAILPADVAGYSRLMGEREPGTAKLVRERREAAMPIVRS
jgi:class 3 adenylate cyclase